MKSIQKSEGRVICYTKQNKNISGFTLIEIIIVVTILGIIFIYGANYLISFLREHRFSVQNDFLYREARYAMDFIINGTMKEEDPNEFFRYAGIIGSYDVKIINNLGLEDVEGQVIWLYKIIDGEKPHTERIGRILAFPPIYPVLLFFDEDEFIGNKNEHMILPKGISETGIRNPYKIRITFNKDLAVPSLYHIKLNLNQNISGRELNVDMYSSVSLRNQDPNIILIDDK